MRRMVLLAITITATICTSVSATRPLFTPTTVIQNGQRDILYGGTGEWNGSMFYRIDPATAEFNDIGPTGLSVVRGLAINSQGEIYATDMIWIYRIDGVTGFSYQVGIMPSAFYFGLAYDTNDILYGITNAGNLWTIDPTVVDSVVAGVEIGETGIVFGPGAMAFDPTNNDLYVSHRDIDAIYKVNPLTADSFLLGFTELFNSVVGLAFDAAGFMYGVSSTVYDGVTPQDIADLILIDKTSGLGTVIGQLGHVSTESLALAPGEPTGIDIHTPSHRVSLDQNEPNPFNPTTVIRYTLPSSGRVELSIYNALGQRVRTLVDEFQASGDHHRAWDGRNDAGRAVSSGVYLYRLAVTAGDRTVVQSRKMTLLK